MPSEKDQPQWLLSEAAMRHYSQTDILFLRYRQALDQAIDNWIALATNTPDTASRVNIATQVACAVTICNALNTRFCQLPASYWARGVQLRLWSLDDLLDTIDLLGDVYVDYIDLILQMLFTLNLTEEDRAKLENKALQSIHKTVEYLNINSLSNTEMILAQSLTGERLEANRDIVAQITQRLTQDFIRGVKVIAEGRKYTGGRVGWPPYVLDPTDLSPQEIETTTQAILSATNTLDAARILAFVNPVLKTETRHELVDYLLQQLGLQLSQNDFQVMIALLPALEDNPQQNEILSRLSSTDMVTVRDQSKLITRLNPIDQAQLYLRTLRLSGSHRIAFVTMFRWLFWGERRINPLPPEAHASVVPYLDQTHLNEMYKNMHSLRYMDYRLLINLAKRFHGQKRQEIIDRLIAWAYPSPSFGPVDGQHALLSAARFADEHQLARIASFFRSRDRINNAIVLLEKESVQRHLTTETLWRIALYHDISLPLDATLWLALNPELAPDNTYRTRQIMNIRARVLNSSTRIPTPLLPKDPAKALQIVDSMIHEDMQLQQQARLLAVLSPDQRKPILTKIKRKLSSADVRQLQSKLDYVLWHALPYLTPEDYNIQTVITAATTRNSYHPTHGNFSQRQFDLAVRLMQYLPPDKVNDVIISLWPRLTEVASNVRVDVRELNPIIAALPIEWAEKLSEFAYSQSDPAVTTNILFALAVRGGHFGQNALEEIQHSALAHDIRLKQLKALIEQLPQSDREAAVTIALAEIGTVTRETTWLVPYLTDEQLLSQPEEMRRYSHGTDSVEIYDAIQFIASARGLKIIDATHSLKILLDTSAFADNPEAVNSFINHWFDVVYEWAWPS